MFSIAIRKPFQIQIKTVLMKQQASASNNSLDPVHVSAPFCSDHFSAGAPLSTLLFLFSSVMQRCNFLFSIKEDIYWEQLMLLKL